jgi:pimeloyl-ACP methyl ester carboxylesterase
MDARFPRAKVTSHGRTGIALVGGMALWTGCAAADRGPTVFYLDGAGWYSSSGSVRQGLKDAGYTGDFDVFTWSAFLGPAHDHFVNASDKGIARRLARRIEAARAKNGDAPIYVMGLSAGCSLVLSAIEQLKDDVQVDGVVLFSPSVSATRDLTPVMRRVRGRLYATCSPHDAIIAGMAVNADGLSGPPAGRAGFKLPRKQSPETLTAYRRVVNLPWQPAYVGFDWNGSHTAVTRSRFVSAVIAPRLFNDGEYPLDRSIYDLVASRSGGRP